MVVEDKIYETLIKVRDNVDSLVSMDLNEFAKQLVEQKLFKDTKDIKYAVLEFLESTYRSGNAEWPISYNDNQVPEVSQDYADEEYLTDEYIKNNF